MSQNLFDNYEFRCHVLGYLLSQSKTKSNLEKYNDALYSYKDKVDKLALMKPELKTSIKLREQCDKLKWEIERLEPIKHNVNLSQTCKSKLSEIFTEVTTGRIKDIKSKYLEKGLHLEEDAITAYSRFTGLFHKKNKVRKSNGFVSGELDIETTVKLADTKVSWDIFTFDAVSFTSLNPIYEWQLQAYMWLWDLYEAELVYVLLNTPEHLIVAEEKKLLWEFVGNEEDYKEACVELRQKMIYDDLPLERKVKIFKIKRDQEKIDKIELSVPMWRAFLNSKLNLQTNESQYETED